MDSQSTCIPRIALFIRDSAILKDAEGILRTKYSSLMLLTEKEKIREFPFPLLILVDQLRDVSEIRSLNPIMGTRILVILPLQDEEIACATYAAGADEVIPSPLHAEEFLSVTEKYLEGFRKAV